MKAKRITVFYALKQIGIITGPVCVTVFLADIEGHCISKSDAEGFCMFAINNLNSTGYFQPGLQIRKRNPSVREARNWCTSVFEKRLRKTKRS